MTLIIGNVYTFKFLLSYYSLLLITDYLCTNDVSYAVFVGMSCELTTSNCQGDEHRPDSGDREVLSSETLVTTNKSKRRCYPE